jgi:cysteinyl-tRNA synthetase
MATRATREERWTPPSGVPELQQKQEATLTLYNSLVDDKVPFVPANGQDSKSISWYTCGPTVYDSAHVGHARNYLTFDIIRRVVEDYFGYNCLFVMNVTDVDDKIILRARRNYLLAQYKAAATSGEEVGRRLHAAPMQRHACAHAWEPGKGARRP